MSDSIDGIPFVVSISTLMCQLAPQTAYVFVAHLCQYMNSLLCHQPLNDNGLQDLAALFYFLVNFSRLSPRGDEVKNWMHQFIPSYYILPNIISKISR